MGGFFSNGSDDDASDWPPEADPVIDFMGLVTAQETNVSYFSGHPEFEFRLYVHPSDSAHEVSLWQSKGFDFA